eukprot:1294163-Karenia_brevis.AAC.1
MVEEQKLQIQDLQSQLAELRQRYEERISHPMAVVSAITPGSSFHRTPDPAVLRINAPAAIHKDAITKDLQKILDVANVASDEWSCPSF